MERRRDCDACGEKDAAIRVVEYASIPYGVDGPGQVILTVPLPLWNCSVCHEQYYDGDGEDAIEAAVKRHLSAK